MPDETGPVQIETIPELGAGRMDPVSFQGCFGWLHQASLSQGSDTAVLLCTGLHHDASTAHRSFRMLADRLVDAGYLTLRFDYAGTGDSCDPESDELLHVLLSSVDAAVRWLKKTTGARQLVLIGLRFGGLLATLAASTRQDVAGLVLLEPVVRGRSYVGQLLMEARLRPGFVAEPDGGFELDGLRLTGETVQRLRQLDLRQVTLQPGCAISIFGESQTVVSGCVNAWQDGGARVVACHSLTGLESFLRPAHLADEPCGDFAPILSWLRATVPPSRMDRADMQPAPQLQPLRHGAWVESALRFGTHNHLLGVLCQPSDDASSQLAVIIGNTGGHPHHGFARFAVEFARLLARAGIASLRMDFAGLGDSVDPSDNGDGATHVFEIDRAPDIRAAMDALEQRGYRVFALHGLCSGAYHALHGALADKRVSVLLTVNLPWFTLRFEKPGPSSFARTAIAELERRPVRTLLLFAEGDAGLKTVEKHFGPGGSDLADLSDIAFSVVADIDHNLTGKTMRRIVADRMISFLRQSASVRELPVVPSASAFFDTVRSLVSPEV